MFGKSRGQVATRAGNLDGFLFLVLPDGLVKDGTLGKRPCPQPGIDLAIAGSGPDNANVDAGNSNGLPRVYRQFDDGRPVLLFDDACRYVGCIVAVGPQGRERISDRLVDHFFVITRPEPGPRTELHGVDVAQHICRKSLVQPGNDVSHVGMCREDSGEQEQTD